MTVKSTLLNSSHLPARDRGEMKANGMNIFASGDVEKALIAMAKRYPAQLEIGAFIIGDNPNRLNLAVLPHLMLGVGGKEGHLQTRRKLEHLIRLKNRVVLRPGVEKNIENGLMELGIQVTVSNDEYDDMKAQFIPMSELILDRPLVQYLSLSSIETLFPGISMESTDDGELKNLIIKENGFTKLPQLYFNGADVPQKIVTYLQDHALNIDMLSAGRSLHPTLEFLLHILDPVNNQFKGGEYYGFSHIHYNWTEKRIAQETALQNLRKIDPRWVELITPGDAIQIISNVALQGRLSQKELIPRVTFVGVTALELFDNSLIGTRYFDFINLSRNENSGDYDDFIDLTLKIKSHTSYDYLKQFYYLARKYSSPELPPYVTS